MGRFSAAGVIAGRRDRPAAALLKVGPVTPGYSMAASRR
jgi:hypothetical protein